MIYILQEDEVTRTIDRLKAEALKLKEKFDNTSSIEVLRGRLEVFNDYYGQLKEKIDRDLLIKSDLARHVSFLNRYINSDNRDFCIGDIESIYEDDLDNLKTRYIAKTKNKYFDEDL